MKEGYRACALFIIQMKGVSGAALSIFIRSFPFSTEIKSYSVFLAGLSERCKYTLVPLMRSSRHQMKGVSAFSPNDVTHPEFGKALRWAAECGVEIKAVDCLVDKPPFAPRFREKIYSRCPVPYFGLYNGVFTVQLS